MMRVRCLAIATLLVLGLATLATAQQGPGPITWLSFETTKSGTSRDLIGASIEKDGPMYDELLANGTLTSWGIAIPITHTPRDHMNYMLWATMDGWSRVGELEAGFMKLFASRTPEQMAEGQKLYQESVEEDSHHDWIIRHEVYRQGSLEVPPKYFRIGYFKATPGNEGKISAAYKEHFQPIYQQLLDDGVITGFGLSVQELHGVGDWTHIGWYTMADLGAIDTVQAATANAMSEEDAATIGLMMDSSAHWDQVLLIVHLGGMPAQQ
jgi:hypothetical protein